MVQSQIPVRRVEMTWKSFVIFFIACQLNTLENISSGDLDDRYQTEEGIYQEKLNIIWSYLQLGIKEFPKIAASHYEGKVFS